MKAVRRCLWEYDLRSELSSFCVFYPRICHYYDYIAFVNEVSRSSVEAYYSRVAFAAYDVRLEPCPVGNVYDAYFLVLVDVGGFHQSFVYCDTAYVVEVCLRYCGSVYFRFKNVYLHWLIRLRYFFELCKKKMLLFRYFASLYSLFDYQRVGCNLSV